MYKLIFFTRDDGSGSGDESERRGERMNDFGVFSLY